MSWGRQAICRCNTGFSPRACRAKCTVFARELFSSSSEMLACCCAARLYMHMIAYHAALVLGSCVPADLVSQHDYVRQQLVLVMAQQAQAHHGR